MSQSNAHFPTFARLATRGRLARQERSLLRGALYAVLLVAALPPLLGAYLRFRMGVLGGNGFVRPYGPGPPIDDGSLAGTLFRVTSELCPPQLSLLVVTIGLVGLVLSCRRPRPAFLTAPPITATLLSDPAPPTPAPRRHPLDPDPGDKPIPPPWRRT